jgi:multidrug transporter EmrE-like cation transporter
VVELVYTIDLKSIAARLVGSTPTPSTKAMIESWIKLLERIPTLFLLVIAAVAVIFGDYMAKCWSVERKGSLFALAITGYILTGLFFIPTLTRNSLSVNAVIWVLLDTMGFLFIGLVIFKEQLNFWQGVAVLLGTAALVLFALAEK